MYESAGLGGVSLHGEGYHIAMGYNNMDLRFFHDDHVSFRVYNEIGVQYEARVTVRTSQRNLCGIECVHMHEASCTDYDTL